jgi:hypothetical protein
VKRVHLAGVWILLCLLVTNCGGGKSTTTQTTGPQSGVQITSPATSPTIDAGQSVNISANQSVLWSIQTAFGKPVGCLGSASPCTTSTTTPSATVTYISPGGLAAAAQVSVVATSATDATQSATEAIFVNLPVSIEQFTFLTSNTDCQYSPTQQNNDGTVNATYVPGANVGSLLAQGGTGPYTWSVATGALPVGLTLGTVATGPSCGASSCAFLYGTPVSVGCSQFQVEVTDAAGTTSTSPTYYVVITPTPLKVQVPNYTDIYSSLAYPPAAFSASGGTPPYAWSVTAGSPLPPNMSLTPVPNDSAAAFISGTPASAPTASPALTVADAQTPYPAVGQVTLTLLGQNLNPPQSACTPYTLGGISAGTFNASMMGSYAFLLRGFDANGAVAIAGSFTADGAGNVPEGVEDILRTTSSGSQADVSVSGSYSVFQQQSDNNTFREVGCVTLTDSGGTTSTFAFTLGGCSTTTDPTSGECLPNAQSVPGVFTTGRVIEFDGAGTQVSGILRLQDTSAFTAGLSGSYAFGLSGWDPTGNTRYAAAGSVGASSGALSSVAADINDGGTLQSAQTGGSGSYAVDTDTTGTENGRGTATLTVGTASLNLVFYVISTQEVMLSSTGTPSAANPIVTGEAISAAGPFSAQSLQNSHMFHIAGLAPTGPDASIGILSFDGVGSVSGAQYGDQAGSLGTTSLSGSYTVNASSGRVAFLASSTNSQSLGDHPLVAYVVPVPSTLTRQDCVTLASCVTGFLVSTDATAQAGLLEFQTPSIAPPPPFSILYVAGYYFYGTDEAMDSATPLINGASTANPTGAKYGAVQSVNYPVNSFYCQQEPSCALLLPNEAISPSGAYAVNSNGSGSVGGETVAVTNGNVIFYIDESPINLHPSVVVVEQ